MNRNASSNQALRRRVRRVTRRAWLTLLVPILLAGCVPLFLPPVPAELPVIEPKLLLRDVQVVREADLPVVTFTLRSLPEEGWLALQWFPPAGDEVASASLWLATEDVGSERRAEFPADVERVQSGRWRVVMSWDGAFVRQLEWSEPAE